MILITNQWLSQKCSLWRNGFKYEYSRFYCKTCIFCDLKIFGIWV